MSTINVSLDELVRALSGRKVKTFGSLLAEVVKKGLCTFCGACIASCPYNAIAVSDEQPKLVSKCVSCEICYYQCPRVDWDDAAMEQKLFGRVRKPEEPLGIYRLAYSARATNPEILKVAQDGGVVTALLAYALDNGVIDAAVVSGVDPEQPWKPVPRVVLRSSDLLATAGTKYTPCPNLIGLASAVVEYGLERVGFVGTPCQVRAIRKMQDPAHGCLKLSDKVVFTIGLFCMESFGYEKLVKEFVWDKHGVDPSSVTKFAITKGKFIVWVGEEEKINVPIKELDPYVRDCCRVCNDFGADFADISVGSVGSPDGWSTVLVRTEVGEKLFAGAVENRYVEYQPLDQVKPGIQAAEKLAQRKRAEKQ